MASVLIMEDDPEQAMLLGDWLDAEGHTFMKSSDADEALAILNKDEHFDIVITDVFVSKSTSTRGGLSLIGGIRHSSQAHIRDIPIITMSGISLIGKSDLDVSNQCFALGSNMHFTKPVNLFKLRDAIYDLIRA